jgi:O-antigen ligase
VTAWLPLSQGFGIFGMLLLGKDGRRKKRAYFMVLVVLLLAILLLTGCGGTPIQTSAAAHATPAGTYHLLLVGQSASAQHVIILTLNVR